MERHRRPPGDVEEALSSMLWTPYQRSPSDSSDEESECNLRTQNNTSKLQTKITSTDLYSITDRHLYSKPVRYRGNFTSNYGYFVPKTYNSLNCELPSYEHIEKERTFGSYFFSGFNTDRINNANNSNNISFDNANNNNSIYSNSINNNNNLGHNSCSSSGNNNNNNNLNTRNNNANCPSNGIYMIHEHSKCPTSMVHSFTDDFLQYQFQNMDERLSTQTAVSAVQNSDAHSSASINRFSNDFSLLDIRFLTDHTASIDETNRNLNSRSGETIQLMSTSPNTESSVIRNTNNCTNSINAVVAGSCVVGQHRRNRDEDLPERVSKLNRTTTNDASIQATQHENASALRTRDTLYGVHKHRRVGNDRAYSTAAATATATTSTMYTIRNETTINGNRETRETQTTTATAAAAATTTSAMTTTNGSSLVNIGSSQALFSRDRLFHASVSSTAHSFFDLFKFSRNSESNIRNLSCSNRGNILQKNSCVIAAMRLNVPNQDSTAAVAAREPSISVSSTRINRIDNSKTIVNISNAYDDGCSLPTTMTATTTSTSCSSASHIFENGTLLGTIVSQAQPSLTIQVNQNSEHQSQQTQQNEQTQQVNFVSYRAVPVHVVNNNSSDSQNKNSIDIRKSDKTNSINDNDQQNSMQSQTKIHTNLSESSEKCDNIEFIDENTTNSNANTNTNTNGNVNGCVVLSDGVQSGFVNSNSGNSNMISVTDNTNNSSPNNHTSQVHLNQHRTFTSTEAQTDNLQQQPQQQQPNQNQDEAHRQQSQLTDCPLIESTVKNSTKPNHSHSRRNGNENEAQSSREQRRRERRERRQPRNARQHVHPPNQSMTATAAAAMHSHHSNCEILPDILHNHVISHPPPYTTLPMPSHCQINAASVLTQSPPPSVLVPGPPPSALIPVGISDDGRYTFPLPIMRRSPSERPGKDCCGQWFAGPPLRAVIAVVALGGVACALGGAALGATGLAGPPTSHLTAALLMIGVGVILVTVSGAAWRMTAPGSTQCLGIDMGSGELGRCGRRPCSGRAPGFLYPEFQHRPPPPSYQASMQEYRLRLLLLDRDRQAGVVRGASPPPTYRSHAGTLLRAPLSVRGNNVSSGPGSEHSLPPSYNRTRTNNLLRIPAIIGVGNSNNTTSAIQPRNTNDNNTSNTSNSIIIAKLSKSSTDIQGIDELFLNANNSSSVSHDTITNESNAKSAEIENATNSESNVVAKIEDDIKSGSVTASAATTTMSTSSIGNDLVTIVTITGCTTTESSTGGEMNILAHL
ncbi:putative uncharacterized protein DDB_G0286901 [Contarinia nasturtii]|uniref:putative uncharacterized protein DDB_G0286901 n=1 Tax=Contarinia nasturtii TaxID=265458 RepID=UPI0012D4699C|nr:putative uncharacterized protein DDB_G0286901 [Contarinia nasturtii]